MESFVVPPDSLYLYPRNNIVDLLSLIYNNPLCKNITHLTSHRVLCYGGASRHPARTVLRLQNGHQDTQTETRIQTVNHYKLHSAPQYNHIYNIHDAHN